MATSGADEITSAELPDLKQESSFSLIENHEDDHKRQTGSLKMKTTTSSDEDTKKSPQLKFAGILSIFVLMLLSLLLSAVSKLSLLSLTGALHQFTMAFFNETLADGEYLMDSATIELYPSRQKLVTIYWHLLIILMIPNVITFLRCFFFSFVGKTRRNFPWPKKRSVVAGLVFTSMEVVGVSFLVFKILALFSVGVSISILNGIFFCQIIVDIHYARRKCNTCNIHNCRRHGYTPIESRYNATQENEESCPLIDDAKPKTCLGSLHNKLMFFLDHPATKVIALLCQIGGLVGCLILWSVNYKDRLTHSIYLYSLLFFLLPAFIFFISTTWTNKYQEWITRTSVRTKTGREKSSLINSTLRLILYPFLSYIIFRYVPPFHIEVDPWCAHKSCEIDISGPTSNLMILHITTSLMGYLMAWAFGKMALTRISLSISLLSTPISLIFYIIVQYIHIEDNIWFPFYIKDSDKNELRGYPLYALIVAIFIWIGGVLNMASFISKKIDTILASDKDIFLTPHYDSIFFEQHILLNSQVMQKKDVNLSSLKRRDRKCRKVFICSTMYRETATEMKQMLVSIGRVAKHYANKYKENDETCDKFESHIFFDGAIVESQVENFGIQLLSLLEETLNVNLKKGIKTETPYGYTFSWKIGDILETLMPFTIHFKDKNKVKAKKRWSQVMYMNYVLKYRIKNDPNLDPDCTYILTTDADIDFTADSAIALLDMMDCNDKVAAVSARTHPKGYGLVYWYQIFDYAIGHWFQKPAEHIFGSVLCSPGCFSVFRCSALEKVLEEYSTEVSNAMEFLMKDMGEDRWLCTLIIKEGYRLDYCAISEDYTYCPIDFEEFYKQRRRWIPSTIANLITLVTEYNFITKNNDSVSILYIIFQFIMIFSVAIAPATVVLVISAGLESFNIPASVSVALFFTVGVIYGLLCLYASPKAQLDVAKILTFFFSIIMALVIIGIFKEVIEEITGSPKQKLVGPADCSGLNHSDTEQEFILCMKSREYALNSNNSIGVHFTIPVTPTVMYIGALAATFLGAGIVHYKEKHCLIHSIWFLLALPSGYLLLLIYSAANLCDRSWGTREQSSGKDEGIWGWKKYLVKAWNLIAQSRCSLWCYGGPRVDDNKTKIEADERRVDGVNRSSRDEKLQDNKEDTETSINDSIPTSETSDQPKEDPNRPSVSHPGLKEEVIKWLIDQKRECQEYTENFEEDGYTTFYFLASITELDLEAIGISKAGFRHRLMREIKSLEKMPKRMFDFPSDDQEYAVGNWLKQLELGEYAELFHYEGYRTSRDQPALALLGKRELKNMGINKRAHLQRLTEAIGYLTIPAVPEAEMKEDVRDWLEDHECGCYVDLFIQHGYTTKSFISGIKDKELQEVGVEKRGLRMRLQKAAQRLPSLSISTSVPDSVESWLQDLELEEYKDIFHREGYKTMEDIENLKELSLEELKCMGILKKAHLHRLMTALSFLAKPSLVDINKRNTKSIIDGMPSHSLKEIERTEFDFWNDLIQNKLKPVAIKFTPVKDVQKSLESLRNLTMASLLLINIIWIALLGSLTFWQLQQYGIDPRAFQLLYLSVYGFIIIVQFIAMIIHRILTLIHYLGRVKPEREYEELVNVSMSNVPLHTMPA